VDFDCHNYILDEDGQPVPCRDLMKWAMWYETSGDERKVAETFTELLWISTVFLGTDHNFFEDGPPILWETMIFDRHPHLSHLLGETREVFHDHDCWRWTSLEEAKAGHAEIVMNLIRKEQANAEAVRKVLEHAH
jgi:hypothetical protein